MPLPSRLLSWYRNLFHRSKAERELDEELCAYLDLLTAEKMKLGMAPDAARRAAALELGGLDLPARRATRLDPMLALRHD